MKYWNNLLVISTLLPDHHKDPFDRLLIARAMRHKALIVTKDQAMLDYSVKSFLGLTGNPFRARSAVNV